MSSESSEKQDSADALANENKQLKDEAERLRQPFIDSLVKDARGAFNSDELSKLSVADLTILRRNFNNSVAKDYADFLEKREQKSQDSIRRFGTVGSYNQETKEFEDGV